MKIDVPPSGGSLEIGNDRGNGTAESCCQEPVPPSGGSLEIGNSRLGGLSSNLGEACSPFGGIPRNWKLRGSVLRELTVWSVFPLRGDP